MILFFFAHHNLYKYVLLLIMYFIIYKIYIPSEVNEPHEGLRKNESQWPIHRK